MFRNKFTKDMKGLHTKRKKMQREIKETQIHRTHMMLMDWKTQHVQMSELRTLIYRLNTIPIKITSGYFVEIEHYFKTYMDMQRI